MSALTLSGKISRITFHDEEKGYTVARLETADFDEITVAGNMPDVTKGMPVELSGDWVVHPKYGKQFKFDSYRVPQPTSADGAIAYLGTLKHVKESVARAIWERFGDETFKVMDETPDRLIEVKGIGKKTLPKIIDSYQKTKGLRQLIGFLQGLGVSAGYAPRIYKEYREEAIAIIKSNPYILADTVRGFGFKKADEVARGLGIEPSSPKRIEAAILHVLKGAGLLNGHCFLVAEDLYLQVCEILALPDYQPSVGEVAAVEKAMRKASNKESRRTFMDVVDGAEAIYHWQMYRAEAELADYIRDLAGAFSNPPDVDEFLNGYEAREGLTLAAGQRDAVRAIATNKVAVLTGGAGTGKTSVSKAIIQLWHSQGKKIVLAAPTGKAAQRAKEATGLREASTIHRLLGWSGMGFERDASNPIPGDAFLIDEASMVDLKLAHALFKAIPRHASVLLVGDVNQLPSVGAGNVLRDIINCGEIPVARLTEVFRQAATSRIISSSHQINAGAFPDLETIGRATDRPLSDALWLKCPQAKIQEAIAWLVSEKLPELGWQPDQIQCLSPQHRGEAGNIALNQLLQKLWNPPAKHKREVRGFREGDRVIQTVNNYDLNVFNGDIGKIEAIDVEEKEVKIRFPDPDSPNGRVVTMADSDLEDVMLANSISIHKSQGAEFPVVIIPATMQHYMMLQRNLLYTGITRAKKLIVMVGEEKAIAHAVRTEKIGQRNTGLCQRLIGGSR